MNDEEKELYVGGWDQLVPTTALDLEIPDDIDEDDDDALVELFRQQTLYLTFLERATIYQNNFVNCHHKACRVWHDYDAATKAQFIKKMAAGLNKITIPGMLVQFPDFFYLMYKKNDLEETIIQCIYLDWKYVAGVIRLTINGGASPHGDARNRSY